jgi:phenylalanyl-tRNA synthetase beta chain
VSWLRALVPGLTASADEIAAALLRAGLEVEQVERVGHDVSGVVVGEVLDVEELTGFKKLIRYCHVSTGAEQREVVCGATNFAPGDRVPFALPGALLPGGFAIATRQTYGHTSDGMICSEAELGLAAESPGILVLPPTHRSAPTSSSCSRCATRCSTSRSRRTAATRSASAASPARPPPPSACSWPTPPTSTGRRRPAGTRCGRRPVRRATATSPASSPVSTRSATARLAAAPPAVLAGMRPVSLAVDVTNHVMLELVQPLHAFDLDALQGEVVVRGRARGAADDARRAGTALGRRGPRHHRRQWPRSRWPASWAAAPPRCRRATTSLLLESGRASHRSSIARTAPRHRLPSEASKRYERGVDAALADAAAEVAVRMLVELGGATPGPVTDVDTARPQPVLALPVRAPERTCRRPYDRAVVVRRLEDVGCTVSGDGDVVDVVPADLAARPDRHRRAGRGGRAARGLRHRPGRAAGRAGRSRADAEQRLRRTASRALATPGWSRSCCRRSSRRPPRAVRGGRARGC